MGAVIALIYLIGIIGSVVVGRSRAGITQSGRLSMETILRSLPWFLTQMAAMAVWPVFLVVWIARGRPASPWKCTPLADGTLTIRRRTAS